MTFEEIIGKLGEDAGSKGGYQADEDGVVRLVFDDEFFVGLMEAEEHGLLLMWCPVAELPPSGGEKLAVELLKANHFGRATAGGTLSVSDEGVVFIQRQMSLSGTEYEDFRKGLEGLVGTAVQWRQLIESCRAEGLDDESVRSRKTDELHRAESGDFLKV